MPACVLKQKIQKDFFGNAEDKSPAILVGKALAVAKAEALHQTVRNPLRYLKPFLSMDSVALRQMKEC